MDLAERQKKASGVTALMNNFRDALLALLPQLQKANITWKQLEDIDIFDGVCESLFQMMVLPKIEAYMNKKHNFVPPLPKYGFFYKDYSKSSYIEVIPERGEYSGEIYVFVYFKSVNSPFDYVVCNIIDDKGNVLRRDVEISYDDAIFRFRFKGTEGDIILS